MTSLKIYLRFIFLKLTNGFLFSLSVLFFVDDHVVKNIYPILIIQEYYFSYFYTAKKNHAIFSRKKNDISLYILLSLIIFIFIIYNYNFSPEVYFGIFLSLIFFSVFIYLAPENELNNVTDWVDTENIISLYTVILLSLLLLINYIYELKLDYLIIFRMGFFYLFAIVWIGLKNKKNSDMLQVEGNYNFKLKLLFVGTLPIISIFIFKLSYFNAAIENQIVDGFDIKIFIFFYDCIAALLGLYIRRVIVIHTNNIYKIVKNQFLISLLMFFMFFIYLILAYSSVLSLLYLHVVIQLIVFILISLNFNLFTLKTIKYKWVLILMYILSSLLILTVQNFDLLNYYLFIPAISSMIFMLIFLLRNNMKVQ